jgi:hypothetical protein
MVPGRTLAWPLLLGALPMLVGSGWLWVRYERGAGPAG